MKLSLPSEIYNILSTLEKEEFKAYIIGGASRSIIENKVPKDWDITTDCKPKKVKDIFQKIGYKISEYGIDLGSIKIKTDNFKIEITTFRKEGNYINHRKPETVEYVDNLSEDIKRRDFTINAIAIDKNGNIIDYYNGILDLKQNILKGIGNPYIKFVEDPLRIIRGIRFSSELNLRIEDNTLESMMKNAELVEKINRNRLRLEIEKILLSKSPSLGIKLLYRTKIIKYIGIIGVNRHSNIYDSTDRMEKDIVLRIIWFVLLSTNETYINEKVLESSRNFLSYMNYSKKIKSVVDKILMGRIEVEEIEFDWQIKKYIGTLGLDIIKNIIYLENIILTEWDRTNSTLLRLEKIYESILINNEPLTLRDLKIDGTTIKKYGVKDGRKIRNILGMILDAVLKEPKVDQHKELKNIIENY